VVCTYPQTTFSEAMHSNIPTILLFCEEHWPFHPQFDDLIKELKHNKIIFTDPLKAAEHINQVLDNPDEWWLDPSTRKAVDYFFEMCGTVSDNWVDEWVSFFKSENINLSNNEKDIINYDSEITLFTRIKLICMNSIKKCIQLFLPLFRTKIGRVILEMVTNDLLTHTRSINHDGTALSFIEINRLTKFRIDTFSTKEPETLDWIDCFNKNSVFWDIGANVGLYTCYASKKHKCITAAFEPSVFNLELLARNVWINNLNNLVTIIPLPLTEIIKTSNMIMSDTAQGHALSTFGENYGSDGKPIASSFAYQMIGLSMDDAVQIFKLPPPNYIKIDVDGIEHLILKGGGEVLNNAESILIEINDAFLEQSETSRQYLTNSGFILKEKKHADYYDNIKLYSGIEKTTYNQIWIKKN
jgi:FkbM family methyltransferase